MIICSAIHIDDDKIWAFQPTNIYRGFIVTGMRHNNCFMTMKICGYNHKKFNTVQGFLTHDNRFLNRVDAVAEALICNQIRESKKELFSKDLY